MRPRPLALVPMYVRPQRGQMIRPVRSVFGHAYDLDGPDDQRRVERLEVQWGDGNTTTARLEGHGAFRDYHEYESSYEGRTVTVRIVAYGHDGQTASEPITINLPE